MIDPFDLLRDELAAAARRSVGRRRDVRRALLIAAAVLVSGAVAAAAVVSLRSERSAPLRGRAPAASAGDPVTRYRIEFSPRLAAGHADWCTSVAIRTAPSRRVGAVECGPAAPRGAGLIAGGGVTSVDGGGESLNWLVVDARVAFIRIANGRLIRPRADAAIPSGWRSAVWFAPPSAPQSLPRLLDTGGGTLAVHNRAGTRAAGTATRATIAVNPRAPHGRCAIRVLRRRGLGAISERVVSERLPAHASVNGRAFRSCASAVLSVAGRRYTAARLIDAGNPARRAALLPGMRAEPPTRAAGVAGGSITARRAGTGWLVVQGPVPRLRLWALRALRPG